MSLADGPRESPPSDETIRMAIAFANDSPHQAEYLEQLIEELADKHREWQRLTNEVQRLAKAIEVISRLCNTNTTRE